MLTTGNVQDHEKFIEQIKYCRSDMQLPIAEALADKGDGVGKNYAYLSREGIRAYIPVKTYRNEDKREFGIQFNRRRNVYLCPDGKVLTERSYDPVREREHYRSSSSDCRFCSIK